MVPARSNSADAGDGPAVAVAEPLRNDVAGGGAVAELAVAVVAPGPDGAVGGERDAVVAPGADGDDAVERAAAGGQHQCRQRVIVGGAVAELAVVVAAPGPDAAGAVQRETVVLAGGHGADVGQAREQQRVGAVGGGAVTEGTVVVVAPGVDAPVVAHGEAVGLADGNGGAVVDGGGHGGVGAMLEFVAVRHAVAVAVGGRIGGGEVAEGGKLPFVRQAVDVAIALVAGVVGEGIGGIGLAVTVAVEQRVGRVAGLADAGDGYGVAVEHGYGPGLVGAGAVAELAVVVVAE